MEWKSYRFFRKLYECNVLKQLNVKLWKKLTKIGAEIVAALRTRTKRIRVFKKSTSQEKVNLELLGRIWIKTSSKFNL